MQVIFRVDSSYNMGTGHVMRCLSLADGLTTQSQAHPKPIFICKNHQGNLSQTIEQRGYQTHLIPNTREPTLDTNTWLGGPWQEDAEATIQIIQNLPQSESQSESEVQWLVIDHYDIHLNWEQKIEETFPQIKLMSIDDYLDRKHAVDVLLNQMYFKNLTKIKNEYRNLMINPKTQLLIGTHYCLLNPIIQKYRKPPNSEVPSLFPT
jgi:spore coat polysaccharide biosynthesis predicted glycosyltransferase SpsG